MRVFFASLGCRLNEAEVRGWEEQFRAAGHLAIDAPERADLTVLNTCSVTGEAARKSRRAAQRLRRASAGRLLVTGCLATLDAAALRADLVVPNADKDTLVERALLGLGAGPPAPDLSHAAAGRRTRAFVKVGDGCRHRCTFCVVTVARGEERSRPVADVVAEVRRLEGEGVRDVVLTAVHLGGYGRDRGTGLAGLVEALLERTAIPRIRLGSVEPWSIGPGFFDLWENPRLCPHLHLPVQSGSANVLGRMGRRGSPQAYASVAARARAAHPRFHLTTDVLVGFPGESDDEWAETLRFLESMRFGQIHAFRYSARPGTRAAELPGRTPAAKVSERMDALGALARRHQGEHLGASIGARLEVLWERHPEALAGGGLRWHGHTDSWLAARVETGPGAALANQLTPFLAERAWGGQLHGRLPAGTQGDPA